ncbi:MAG TPA: DNA topoisomerase [Massilia sp.]|nr:DNA topoisomerase [Massilia sp.]
MIGLPWQASVICAVVAFVVLRWILPLFFAANPLLSGIAALAVSLSSIAFWGFCFIGFLAFMRPKITPAGPYKADRSAPSQGRPRVVIMPQQARNIAPEKTHSTPPPRHDEQAKPKTWTLEALRSLEWKRFELLCAKYYEAAGFFSETIRCGPDGGIDVKLYRIDPEKPLAIVQCKAWADFQVGVKEIRELLGVMAHEKIGRGIFITTSGYTAQALEFGSKNPLQLLNGPQFLERLRSLPAERQIKLLQFAFEGDYTTPSCASCGGKMVRKQGKRGEFWGCTAYPRCKTTMAMRRGA